MTTPAKGSFRIVLLGIPLEAQPAVIQSVQQLFSLSKTMAGKIGKAAPIVLLNQLQKDDANLLCTALDGITKAGGTLQVEEVGAQKLPIISWPAPPCIDGKDLPTVLESLRKMDDVRVEVACPCCGEALTLTLSFRGGCQGATPSAAQSASNAAPRSATAPNNAPVASPNASPVPQQTPPSTAAAKPQKPAHPAPPPQPTQADLDASRKKIEEDADALFDGITPLSPFTADHMVGSLEDFETGLINLYEVEENLNKREIGDKKKENGSS